MKRLFLITLALSSAATACEQYDGTVEQHYPKYTNAIAGTLVAAPIDNGKNLRFRLFGYAPKPGGAPKKGDVFTDFVVPEGNLLFVAMDYEACSFLIAYNG